MSHELHVLINSLSLFREGACPKSYTGADNRVIENCIHTNETAARYLVQLLKERGQVLHGIYSFVTPKVSDEGHIERYQTLMDDCHVPVYPIPLRHRQTITEVYSALTDMFNALTKSSGKNKQLTVHIDMTGGHRHSTMLMLALIQVLSYYGATIGHVFYVDFEKESIEEVDELVDMYTLISGAGEFVHYGSVRQIQSYFRGRKNLPIHEQSDQLRSLLAAMEGLAEAIRVCTSYVELREKLKGLYAELTEYKRYTMSDENQVGEREQFFSCLLPTIEKEYGDILPRQGQEVSPVHIIRWCIAKGFLQQAITFYTEWIPRYVVESGILRMVDKKVQTACEERCASYEDWQRYFFRQYQDKLTSLKSSGKKGVIRAIGHCFGEYSDWQSLRNDVAEMTDGPLLTVMDEAEKRANWGVSTVVCLEKKNCIRQFLEDAKNSTDTYERFVRGNWKKDEFSQLSHALRYPKLLYCLLARAFILMPTINKEKWLVSPTSKKDEMASAVTETYDGDTLMEERKQLMIRLCQKGVISSSLPEEEIATFVATYSKHVSEIRNKINHAQTGEMAGELCNDVLERDILSNLSILDKGVV